MCEMLPLETKHSGGKTTPKFVSPGRGVFLGEISRSRHNSKRITKKRKRNITATRLERGL
jgi:hypothetical protein